MSPKKNRKAFTLVELLVVISVIGMLTALLLPAIHSSRESMRRTACLNNVRNLTQAIDAYHDSKNRYPGYWERIGTGSGTTTKHVPWCIVLLPYLDDRNLYHDWRDADNTKLPVVPDDGFLYCVNYPASKTIGVYVCPSDPDVRARTSTNNYVVNGGRRCSNPHPTDPALPDVPANTDCHLTETSANGLFHDRVGNPNLRTSKEDIRDGLSQTLLMGENLLAGNWDVLRDVRYKFGNPEQRVIDASSAGLLKATNVFVWHPVTNPTSDQVINGNFRTATTLTADTARPSSFHFRGANFAFADGRTQWLSQNIDYMVLVHLMTPDGKQLPSDIPISFQSYSLNEADYLPGQ